MNPRRIGLISPKINKWGGGLGGGGFVSEKKFFLKYALVHKEVFCLLSLPQRLGRLKLFCYKVCSHFFFGWANKNQSSNKDFPFKPILLLSFYMLFVYLFRMLPVTNDSQSSSPRGNTNNTYTRMGGERRREGKVLIR